VKQDGWCENLAVDLSLPVLLNCVVVWVDGHVVWAS